MAALLPMASYAVKQLAKPAFVLLLPNTGTEVRIQRDLTVVIRELHAADVKSAARGDSFSRACRGCGVEHPLRRAVSTVCGHAACFSCALDAEYCPVCYVPANFVPLPDSDSSTRRCGVCKKKSPLQRVVLSACSHSMCCVCALQLIPDALSEDAIFCPYCATESPIVFLTEDVTSPSLFTQFFRWIKKTIRKIFC